MFQGWQFDGVGRPLRLVSRPVPEPGPHEVVVLVRASGLCHTDIGVLYDPGWQDAIAHTPIIIGHEFAGEVFAAGSEVTGYSPGDRVGVCPLGPSGQEPGFARDGGFATHAVVPAVDLIPIPDGLDFTAAAIGTDAGATAYNAVVGNGRVREGMRVAIVGLGGLGQFGAQIALRAGADVWVCDPSERAQELARRLGIAHVVNAVSDLAAHEPEVIVDFAGVGSTTADAISAVAVDGRVVQVGLGALTATISTHDLVSKRVCLVGSMGAAPSDLERVYALMASGQLVATTESISFSDIPAGLERLRQGAVQGRLVAVLDSVR